MSCNFTLTNYAKKPRGDVLVIGDGSVGSTAATLLTVKLSLFEKLGSRVEAFE